MGWIFRLESAFVGLLCCLADLNSIRAGAIATQFGFFLIKFVERVVFNPSTHAAVADLASSDFVAESSVRQRPRREAYARRPLVNFH